MTLSLRPLAEFIEKATMRPQRQRQAAPTPLTALGPVPMLFGVNPQNTPENATGGAKDPTGYSLRPADIASQTRAVMNHPAYVLGRPIVDQPREVEEVWWQLVFEDRGIPDPALLE